jgi:ATP-dependent Zn protease
MAVLQFLISFWTWLRGRWAPRRAPAPTVLPPDTVENRIAVHEAGHAVVAWCCTATVEITANVTTEKGDPHVTCNLIRSTSNADWLWARLVILLSGLAAEAHVYRCFRSGGSETDLLQAKEAAQQLIARAAHEPYLGTDLVAPLSRMFLVPLTPDEHRLMSAAYIHAKTLVRSHGTRYFRLISLFMTCKAVTEKQMETVLGSRLPMQLLLTCGVTKFLCPKDGLR